MSFSNTVVIFTISGLMAFQAANRPSPPVSKTERERLFKVGLKQDPIPSGAIELELKRLIPTDQEIDHKEIFFRNAHRFSIDERGHVFIPEYDGPAVYELDRAGQLLRKFDKQGQGPGELRYPNQVWFFDRQIVVCDGGSRRVNFYDRNWTFLRSFTSLSSYWYYVPGIDGTILAISLNGEYLVDVMNAKGEARRSFGALPSKRGSLLNRALMAASPAGDVWVGLASLGKLKKYSSQGSLKAEIDIMSWASPKLKEYLKQNLAWDKKGESKTRQIIVDISFAEEDMLVQAGGLLQPIYRLNTAGRLINTYYIKPEGPTISYGGVRVLSDDQGGEEFFISRKDYEEGDFRVGVYGIKKNPTPAKR